MKNLFLIITTVLSFTTTNFASNIIGELSLVKTEKIELSVESIEQKEFILSSKFVAEHNNLALTFGSSVEMIQIFNGEGELEMMLPIDSKKVNLGLSLFDGGNYRMGFQIEGIEDIQFTSLVIK